MYIGPWQEYRLAKIQDDAVQRLRSEWEAHVRAQLPDGDELRIRELMQPLMAKLPALLLAKSGKPPPSSNQNSRAPSAAASRRSSRPSSSVSTSSSTREGSKRETKPKLTPSSSNQETHNDGGRDVADDASRLSRQSSGRRPKPVTKKKAKPRASSGPTSALAEVEKRKRMFATWLQAHRDGDAAAATEPGDGATRLPPLYPDNHVQRGTVNSTASTQAPTANNSDHSLPPIDPHTANAVTTADAAIESDDSFDEDEVNHLLNWTDNLLSPDALDTSLDALDIDSG